MLEVPGELLDGAFALQRARELGVGEKALRGPRFRAPWSGARVSAAFPDELELRCAAAVTVLPADAAFSHWTAAELLGLWLPHRRPAGGVHITVPTGRTPPRRAGMTGHGTSTWQTGDVRSRLGLRVTSAARTCCDLAAAGQPVEELVVLLDSALRRGLGNREELGARIMAWAGERGARRLRAALDLAREDVDSAMETRLRLLIHHAGLPEPLVNVTVFGDGGGYLHRPDLSWPRWKVALDYDGEHHFLADEHRRRLDIARKEALEEAGWVLRVFTSLDVLGAPGQTVERIRRALRQRGAPL